MYGGTFDPPHNAHLQLAKITAEQLALDALYFIPSAQHPLKNRSGISTVEVRIEMLEKALENYPMFRISQIERDRSDISYTIDTIKQFCEYERTGEADLYFIVGMDNIDEFHLWKNPDEIFREANVVALRRSGSENPPLLEKYKDRIIILDTPLIDISSTQIREKIRMGDNCHDLLPPGIPEIIKKYNLYH